MLRLVDVRAVNTNVLHADKVLSVGSVLGDLGSNPVPVVVAPGSGGEVTTVANTLFVDLEPIARSVVGLDAAGGLGHVDQTGAGVLELGTYSQLEADLLAGVDRKDLRLVSRGESALVADDIGTIDGRAIADIGRRVRGELNWVVLDSTGRLANVLEGGLGGPPTMLVSKK